MTFLFVVVMTPEQAVSHVEIRCRAVSTCHGVAQRAKTDEAAKICINICGGVSDPDLQIGTSSFDQE